MFSVTISQFLVNIRVSFLWVIKALVFVMWQKFWILILYIL